MSTEDIAVARSSYVRSGLAAIKFVANDPPDNEQRFHSTAKSGRLSTTSLIRVSNLTPTTPTLRPKLRKVAGKSFSMAMAFD
jgi:hypothetical protein